MAERVPGLAVLVKLFWVVFAILLFVFAVLAVNQDAVALRLLSWRSPEISVFWWMLLSFTLGVVLAGIGFGLMSMRLRWRHRRELAAQRSGDRH
jgi:uncharacterized integral membrane protein